MINTKLVLYVIVSFLLYVNVCKLLDMTLRCFDVISCEARASVQTLSDKENFVKLKLYFKRLNIPFVHQHLFPLSKK